MTDREKLEKLKKLADAMYYAAQQLTTDASRLHKAMDEYHKFIIHECKEEPVSEDLEEEIDNYVKRNGYDGLDSIEEVKYIANNFVKWQKDKGVSYEDVVDSDDEHNVLFLENIESMISLEDYFNSGDKVIVQIRKKEE